MNFRSLITGVVFCGFAGAGHAYVVDVDPSQFAVGTNISNAFDGLQLSTLTFGSLPADYDGWEPGMDIERIQNPVYAQRCSPCSTREHESLNILSPSSSQPQSFMFAETAGYIINDEPFTGTRVAGSNALLVTFDEGSSYVEVTGGGVSGNFFIVEYWDTNGEFIGRCSSTLRENASDPESSGCTRTYDGSAINPDNAFSHDLWTLTWHDETRKVGIVTAGGLVGGQYVTSLRAAVPEPGSFAALVLPLAMLAGIRQRRRKQ